MAWIDYSYKLQTLPYSHLSPILITRVPLYEYAKTNKTLYDQFHLTPCIVIRYEIVEMV